MKKEFTKNEIGFQKSLAVAFAYLSFPSWLSLLGSLLDSFLQYSVFRRFDAKGCGTLC